MKRIFLLICALAVSNALYAQEPVMSWSFDENHISGDSIEGLYEKVPGIKGKGLLLDGFTTRVVRDKMKVVKPSDEITVDAWVSLGNYPWNWCPVLTTETIEPKGYRLMVGPYGQLSMQVGIGEQWIVCTSDTEVLPLRVWTHITGTYKADDKLEIYVNGKKINSVSVKGKALWPKKLTSCILGMTASEGKPSDLHRIYGTVAQYYGLDGIIDEVNVYDRVLDSDAIASAHAAVKVPESILKPRHLPIVESTGKFKGYYSKLKYYPGWDNVWRVADDPDIVVCFKHTPIKLIFWRGIRYGASWVDEKENWMSDQSVEAWDEIEGCFEHMQDRHCRFSHVRIIENTPGRVVVHWRYAPTSAYDRTWRVDEKTGWEVWVDEYYYIYPDGSATRKVIWTTGSLGPVRQFQETLALLSPGQRMCDLVEETVTVVTDYDGKVGYQKMDENPGSKDPYNGYTIQLYNFKSENKPFICFEPGNVMTTRDARKSTYNRAVGCNHFPVGQARCDGRTTLMADRPSHATSFPISDPVIHRKDGKSFWCGLYGMTGKNIDELRAFGRAWAYAPELSIDTKNIVSYGYDRSERAYQLECVGKKTSDFTMTLSGTKDSPAINPAFRIKNWKGGSVDIYIDGKKYTEETAGIYESIDGNDLILFLFMNKSNSSEIKIRCR